MQVTHRADKPLLKRQEIVARRRALNHRVGTRSPAMQTSSLSSWRMILGTGIFAGSLLGLLALATFEPGDSFASAGGMKNAIGPFGHMLGERLRSLLGICSYVLPLVGGIVALGLFLGNRERRRWPQTLAFGVLLIAVAILAHVVGTRSPLWPTGLGGSVGAIFGSLLLDNFSTAGTVIIAGAAAGVALVIATRFGVASFVRWIGRGVANSSAAALAAARTLWERQLALTERRREVAAQNKAEEAALFAELDAEDKSLAAEEALAIEADEAAQSVERDAFARERNRLTLANENEKLRTEREHFRVEREAARIAREALRRARSAPFDSSGKLAREIADEVASPTEASTRMPLPLPRPSLAPDPKWVADWQPPTRTPAAPLLRGPKIVEPATTIQEVVEDASVHGNENQLPSVDESQAKVAAPAATAPAPAKPQDTDNAIEGPRIVAPKEPPTPTHRPEFEFVGGRTSFTLPPLDVLEAPKHERQEIDKEAFLTTADRLTEKLKDFGIDGEVVEIRPGPVVTMYEFKPAAGVKISRIASLADDLAMAMEAMRVRIVAPIPGKGVVGIEVPNRQREGVYLKDIAEQDAFQKSASKLTMCLGKDIEGMPYILDLAKAPHVLMAGTTGSGKSVSVNAMIMSLLLKSTPEEVRFIMVDPKMLELSVYEGIPHLLLPVVTDPRKAATALQWGVGEMTRRYKLLAAAGVRNIVGYNALIEREEREPRAKPAAPVRIIPPGTTQQGSEEETPVFEDAVEWHGGVQKKRKMFIVDVDGEMEAPARTGPHPGTSEIGVASPTTADEDPREPLEVRAEAFPESPEEQAALGEAASEAQADEPRRKLPYIVVVIDELADLMMVATKEVETAIARLAQMARAAGIHLLVATQRPSTDVVTGIIKANFPTRISCMLRSKPDSMTILGTVGAEALLGMGDMLIMPPTSAHLQRVHGCFVSEAEIKRAVEHLKAQGKPMYDESILKAQASEGDGADSDGDDLSDELYDEALAIVSEMRNVSISMLQRKMRIGYNRSARMIERMERDRVVGPADGARPREVLIRPIGEMSGADAL